MPIRGHVPNTERPKDERNRTAAEKRADEKAGRKEREWREAVQKGYQNDAIRRYK